MPPVFEVKKEMSIQSATKGEKNAPSEGQPGLISISVIIPFHNTGRTIGACIAGLRAQRFPPPQYEVIMIDNNSTDGSAEIVKRNPWFKLLQEKQQGSYAARNTGIKEARGDIIAFTDSDCVPAQNWLKTIAAAFVNPNISIVLGSNSLAGKSPFLSLLAAYENEKNNYIFNSKIKEIYFGRAGNMAVRKKLFQEVGLFAERARGSDTIFVRQCTERHSCDAILYESQMQVEHREIASVRQQYKKFFIYGSSCGRYRHIAYLRPLTNRERLQVFRQTTRRQQYGRLRTFGFFAALAVGLLCWTAGSSIAHTAVRIDSVLTTWRTWAQTWRDR